jgi:hypothetical protein
MDPNEIDPFAMIFITIFVVILASLLFGWALTPRKPDEEPHAEMPGQIMVDLGTLLLRLEIATNAVEIVLRQRGYRREGEGARQVRETVRTTFEEVKNEHLTKIMLQNLGKSGS